MGIWKQIVLRWLGWALGGAFFGILVGAVVGGLHGAVYAMVFESGSLRFGNAGLGFMFGAFYAVIEGAVGGAISFGLAALLRMKSPTLLSVQHFKTTMRWAFWMCALGAVGGAMTGMAAEFLLTRSASYGVRNAVGDGFFYGCQVGFNVGMLCGALLPMWMIGFTAQRDKNLRLKVKDFVADSD